MKQGQTIGSEQDYSNAMETTLLIMAGILKLYWATLYFSTYIAGKIRCQVKPGFTPGYLSSYYLNVSLKRTVIPQTPAQIFRMIVT